MEKLMNSDATVMLLGNHITPRNSEEGGDMFSETSVLTRAIQYRVRDSISEDSVLQPYIVFLYGEADQQ
jgi:hypothetical protein